MSPEVEPSLDSSLKPFDRLVAVVDRLLGPGGCPWDQEQTHESLKQHLLEEVYEVFDAIDDGDDSRFKEELGDLLLQPVMHAQMAALENRFDIDDVALEIVEKLVRRHPHVFGDSEAKDPEAVLKQWDAIKQREKPGGADRSILGGVPRSAPALLRANEISKRAARAGFEWPNADGVFAKLDEEVLELRQAIESRDVNRIEAEIGDLLFTVVNLARWNGVEPENALRNMLDRFSKRFAEVESQAGKPLDQLQPEEWEALWQKAKRSENH